MVPRGGSLICILIKVEFYTKTGGGSSGITADVAEALSAEATEMQQAAAQGDRMKQAAAQGEEMQQATVVSPAEIAAQLKQR